MFFCMHAGAMKSAKLFTNVCLIAVTIRPVSYDTVLLINIAAEILGNESRNLFMGKYEHRPVKTISTNPLIQTSNRAL